MTRFSVRNASREVITAAQGDVWAVMTDPSMLAELTPLVDRIVADGEHWTWHLTGVEAMGVNARPRFTVLMEFEEPRRMAFDHDPPADRRENSGSTGEYLIEDLGDATTALEIDLTMWVDLPLPKFSRGAVERIMQSSTQAAGDRFFANLLRHLDAEAVTV